MRSFQYSLSGDSFTNEHCEIEMRIPFLSCTTYTSKQTYDGKMGEREKVNMERE